MGHEVREKIEISTLKLASSIAKTQMDRIIKLSNAKVPKSFRPKRRKSKNSKQTEKSTDADTKISRRGRKRKEQNAKTQPDQQSSSTSKCIKKVPEPNFTEGRSEVQIELEKLNNQLR